MNKILILILAVCLISAHAFVKRDVSEAPKPDAQGIEKIKQAVQERFNEFSNAMEPVKASGDKLVETLKTEIEKWLNTKPEASKA